MNSLTALDLYFPPEYLKAALVASFLSVWVVIGLFYYLNLYTKRRYFSFWTIGWLFYALWLALGIGSHESPENRLLVMLKHWCVGAAAVFLLWGSARFLHQRIKSSQLALFVTFLFLWSYIAAYRFESSLQIQLPIFSLLALVSLVTAGCFYRLRREQPYLGANLLAGGFCLWGIYLAGYPLFEAFDHLTSIGFFVSAVIQLFIAVGMIVLVLEEVRQTNQRAFQKIRSFKSKTDFLQKRILSTEERYRSLFDQASEGIVITDAERLGILELNQTARRLLGIHNGEANQSVLPSYCQFKPEPQPAPQTGPEWFATLCRQQHVMLVRRDGSMTPTEVDGAPIHFEGRAGYQFFLRELTERARLEQQLRQAEKLSALGQMISGVAHELNNPLAVIQGYLELILRRDDVTPQTRADLQKVILEGNRAAKLVSNFLSFAREQPSHREDVDLNKLIGRIVELRKSDLQKAKVEFRLDLDPELPGTQADPDQIQQVLVNLLNNAQQALIDLPRPLVQITTERTENLILIRIEDNGRGIAPEIVPYIFEPFFTTREVGTATGLGLSIAHSIIADHNGRILYEPAANGGAGFVLELPVLEPSVDPQPASRSEVSRDEVNAAESPAEILVLDDEQPIAELLGEMLGLLGFSTSLSHSAPDALELLETREFDLIISDFRMPRMNGQEFYERAVARKPDLARRIVFITGDVVNEETQAFLRSTGNPHLSKPFQLARVEQIVMQVLGETVPTRAS